MRQRHSRLLLLSLVLVVIAFGSAAAGEKEDAAARGSALLADGKNAEALAELESAVRLGQNTGQTWYELGTAALRLVKVDRALEAFAKAREAGGLPPNQIAQAEARALLKAGKKDEAFKALESITAPAGGLVGFLNSSPEFDPVRSDVRFQALLQKITPCASPEYRQFDFWLGKWDVTTQDGRPLGTNTITKRHGGCVIDEEWQSAQGGSGSSFSVYDKRSGKWHQYWVDASGSAWLSYDREGNPATARGNLQKDGSMVLISDVATDPMVRGTWKLLADGRVRQTFDSSKDKGKTWSTMFDGYYRKVE